MADPETIYQWRRLDDRITTSGQPTEPQIEDIHGGPYRLYLITRSRKSRREREPTA
jgi:hypothetical protein